MSKPRTFIEASASGTKGEIRIVSRIGEWSDSSSSNIRSIVDDFLKRGVADTEVYLNSVGGSCLEATEIGNELKRLPKVSLKIGSVAASAATYLMTQFPSVAYPNSQFMIHRPKLGTYGDVVTIKADLKLLENTTADYKTAYSTKMNKTEDQIEEYFAQGDYWMTANEAKKEGLLDAILDQNEEPTAESVKILEALHAPIIPNINKTKAQMERNQLISRLKLSADATDAQIEAALNALEEKAGKADGLEAQAKTDLENKVKELVADAQSKKKITADLADHYTKLATADFDATKKVLDSMPGVTKLSAELEADGGKEAEASRKDWTLEDYQTKDPQALEKMITEKPEQFQKLEAAYFGN